MKLNGCTCRILSRQFQGEFEAPIIMWATFFSATTCQDFSFPMNLSSSLHSLRLCLRKFSSRPWKSVKDKIKTGFNIRYKLIWSVYLSTLSITDKIWRKVNFFYGIKLVWIQRFPSPRLVIQPRLKKSLA